MLTLEHLLRKMVDIGASDLHITVGTTPKFRIDGALFNASDIILDQKDTERLCLEPLSDEQIKLFKRQKELDFSFGIQGLSRFRVNLFFQRGSIGGTFRTIPFQIPKLEELGLPPIIKDLAKQPRGLLLVTGPTGSGKSTTLAAIIDWINENYEKHIITIEDPIEFIHRHKRSLVNQREVGTDTESFKNALRRVLRQDPDIVLIGEMRDLETTEAALNISETGHLTLATLHTNNAVQTINRIIDIFPHHQQNQIRSVLAFVLLGIVSQLLVARDDSSGRILVTEILIATPAIRSLIRDGKVHQIYAQMQMGQAHSQMHTMNQSLINLVKKGIIRPETALQVSPEEEELRQKLGPLSHP